MDYQTTLIFVRVCACGSTIHAYMCRAISIIYMILLLHLQQKNAQHEATVH